jgi:hypothetical protein
MKKADLAAFLEFVMDEAVRYGRTISKAEIETYFENFGRTTLEDFKRAWHEHKRDERSGGYFPKIVDLQRRLRTTAQEQAATDWRCAEDVGGQRCNWPGAIKPAGWSGYYCAAHYRIKGTPAYTPDASLQIIESSKGYVPPKNAMELMAQGDRVRALEGERTRKALGIQAVKRKPDDAVQVSVKPPEDRAVDQHIAEADASHMRELNAELDLAAQESAE